MSKYILVMKPANEYAASLDNAVTTVCDSEEDVSGTILGFLGSDRAEDVDENMDFEEALETIEKELTSFDDEIDTVVFILGDNEEDDNEGMEILVKCI